MKKIKDVKNLNKKIAVTALGVAALGLQLMQTNDVKADTVSDGTGNAGTEETSNQKQDASAVGDPTPINAAANTPQEQSLQDTAGSTPTNNVDTSKQTSEESSADNSGVTTPQNKEQATDTATEPILKDTTVDNSNGSDPYVKGTLSITATNENGSVTSNSTATNVDRSVTVNNDANLSLNLTLKNTTNEDKSDYWSYLNLPRAKDATSDLVISKDADLNSLASALPTGATISFITKDGTSSTSASDIKDYHDITSIMINPNGKPIHGNESVVLSIPLEHLTDSNSQNNNLNSEIISFDNKSAASTGFAEDMPNIYVSSADSLSDIVDNTGNTGTGTTTDNPDDGDIQATAKDPDSILLNQPVEPKNTANVNTNDMKYKVTRTIYVTATTDKGVVKSFSPTNDDLGVTVFADPSAQLTAHVVLKNASDTPSSDYYSVIKLPKSFSGDNATLVMSDDANLKEMEAEGTKVGAQVRFVAGNSNYSSADDLNRLGYKPSDISTISIIPNDKVIKPGQSLSFTIPLEKVGNGDILDQQVGVYNGNLNNTPTVFVNSYDPKENETGNEIHLKGQYYAVTLKNADTANLNKAYVSADEDIQKDMPSYTGGSDVKVNNFVNYYNSQNMNDSSAIDGDKVTTITKGAGTFVDLVNSGIINYVNNNGYSVLLKNDGSGSQQTFYSYFNYGISPQFLNNPNNTDTGSTDNTKYSEFSYITLRHVIDAHDSDAKIGQTWTTADNLTSVQDNSDKTLTGEDALNAVTVSVIDPNGILKDGKVVKDGIFEVSYTYKLKDGTSINKTVAITAGSTTNNSGSSSSHHSSGSSSSNTSNPVVSPNSPDSVTDLDQLLSTHPNKGIARLYKLDTTLITNRSLKPATDWFSDKVMTFAGEDYYRVATNEWVKASEVYVYKDNKIVVETKNNQQLVNSEGEVVTNRALLADTAWYSDRIAYINGKTYYRVATNEFVPTDAVTVR